MKFGKLENGRLISPPVNLKDVPRTFPPEEPDGEPISGLYQIGYDPENTPDYVVDYLLANGWLPVVETPRPEAREGYHWVGAYEEQERDGQTVIARVWTEAADQIDPNPEISAERALNIILLGRDVE